MKEKIRDLWTKYREIIVYLIVGVLTTVFAWGVKFLWNVIFYAGTAHPTSVQNLVLSIVENVAGISFAYPTNRRWVFQSRNPNILKEASEFVASRLATFVMNILLMQLLVNVMHVNFYVSTVINGVLVVIGNYVLSKLFVFRKK